jgi:hypothetical protein
MARNCAVRCSGRGALGAKPRTERSACRCRRRVAGQQSMTAAQSGIAVGARLNVLRRQFAGHSSGFRDAEGLPDAQDHPAQPGGRLRRHPREAMGLRGRVRANQRPERKKAEPIRLGPIVTPRRRYAVYFEAFDATRTNAGTWFPSAVVMIQRAMRGEIPAQPKNFLGCFAAPELPL